MTKTKTPTEVVEPALEGEVIVPEETAVVAAPSNTKALNAIAKRVKTAFGKGIDAQFAIGHALLEARVLLPSNQEFGKWFAAQEFAISQQTAHRLAEAAEREPEVRAFIESQQGRDISPTSAIKELNAGPAVDPELATAGKNVRELLEDETEPLSGFEAWQNATAALNLQVLTVEELGLFATAVKALVEGYQAEKARRSA
jgi:hypothetical protein